MRFPAVFNFLAGLLILNYLGDAKARAQSSDLDFSVEHGFYYQPFELTISSDDDLDQIWYTLDNRDPLQAVNIHKLQAPAVILIDPQAQGLPNMAPAVVIRAVGVKNESIVTPSVTQTYIFPDKITLLSPDGVRPGPDWPDTNSSDINRQFFDYGMDADVYNDPRYSVQLLEGLLDIPSLSIVSNPENLFDADSGMYVNGYGDSEEWERKCSLELIYPDGDAGFQINAGIRIRGGDSRSNANPKHSFRFLFKQKYGRDQLQYPLFDDEGVESFDRIDLRTNQNYSWHAADPFRAAKNTFVRETFSRDTQRDMGLAHTRSRQYHVYLNGLYWGIYMTQERPEANYGESYFGGDESDYDAIKIDKNNDQKIYATDGTTDAWIRLFEATMAGLSSNESYYRLQGLNSDGSKNPVYEKLLDLENFISWLLIYYYVGNYDGIVGLEWNNQKPNNFWAIYKHSDPDGFKFFAHDAEQSMASEDGVTLGLELDRTGPYPQFAQWYWFNGQELHQELVKNQEYLVSFADYVYKYFYNDGVLTPGNSIERFSNRAREINLAVVGESARWGDGNSDRKDNPRTRDDDWLPALNDILTNYLPFRRDIVTGQFRNHGWYPAIDPPLFIYQNDTLKRGDFELLNISELQIINPNYSGEIVYTLDKSDPREIGGGLGSAALSSSAKIILHLQETTRLKARIKLNDTWSALHEINLKIFQPESPLIFSEIHFNPLADLNDVNDEFEFIEIKNIGSSPFNLSGAFFEDGIDYTFPKTTIIESGAMLVLASSTDKFFKRYGFYPFDSYRGRMDNDGEKIKLSDYASKTLINAAYDDNSYWPQLADGQGYSLTTKYPNDFSDPDNAENWIASSTIHGTPGHDDTINFGSPFENQIARSMLFQNYPNPFNNSTTIRYHVPDFLKVKMVLYNIRGQKIMTLINEKKPQGIYNISLNSNGLASGVYIVHIEIGGFTDHKKMALIK